MPKRMRPVKASATATAKIEAVAKASYQRKRIITEIVPVDVTRAKANRWLDLISPITEWAGLKGDALRYRRQQLRVQQEDSLLRLAEAIRDKIPDQAVVRPVPTKILVPAIEKASFEDPSDTYMIDKWADLLASAALGERVEPRFVAILEELSGSQARTLEAVAFNSYEKVDYPGRYFADAPYEIGEYWISDDIRQFVRSEIVTLAAAEAGGDQLAKCFERPGARLELIDIFISRDKHFQWSGDNESIKDSHLHVLESLGLVRRVSLRIAGRLKKPKAKEVQIGIIYYHLTELGVDFCETCCRSRTKELKEIDNFQRRTQETKAASSKRKRRTT